MCNAAAVARGFCTRVCPRGSLHERFAPRALLHEEADGCVVGGGGVGVQRAGVQRPKLSDACTRALHEGFLPELCTAFCTRDPMWGWMGRIKGPGVQRAALHTHHPPSVQLLHDCFAPGITWGAVLTAVGVQQLPLHEALHEALHEGFTQHAWVCISQPGVAPGLHEGPHKCCFAQGFSRGICTRACTRVCSQRLSTGLLHEGFALGFAGGFAQG